MPDELRPVKRVLVVDDDKKLLQAAVQQMPGHDVVCVTTKEEALARCRAEHFDLVICDVFLGDGELASGRDLIKELHADNQSSRRLALVSGGFTVELALLTAKRMPPEIIIRKKRAGMFESILEEAETGLDPAIVWQDEIRTLDDAKREHVIALVTRVGRNRSEAARRLGVDRSTVARILDPK